MSKLFYFAAFFIILTVLACSSETTDHNEKKRYWITTISSDFENFENHFNRNTYQYATDSTALNIKVLGKPHHESARSGKTSVLIEPNTENKIITLTNISKDQLIEVSIWQKKGDTSAFLDGKVYHNGVNTEFRTFYNQLGKAKKGWEQHYLSIPIENNVDSISINLFASGVNAIFDDLKIYIYPVFPSNRITTCLNIFIPNKSKKKLTRYIEKSYDSRVISEKSKQEVKSYYLTAEDTTKIKMKIKGDWADHIYPDKPSYRFKLPSSSSFLGMTSFSVQHPKTRNYLSEWILHKFADRIGLLSTKYEFINVCINGYKMGVYALEEHFEKHIVENRNRREGPILKLNENGTWKYREKTYNHSLEHKYPDYQASFIDAFKGGKIAKSSTLSNQFNEGLKLVQLFREGHADISDIFDLDLLAKYYVLIEISGNYHALIWHNRRFYFNPVTQKLEHIFFDAIPYPKRKESVIKSIIENRSKEDNLVMDNAIIMSKPFKEKYFQYLKEYTDKRFLEKLFDEHKSDLEVFQEAILSENPSYDFSLQDFYNRTKLLRDEMDDLSDYWEAEIAKAKSIEYWMERDVFSTFSGSPVIDGVSVNAYIDTNEKFCEILVENYHINNIEIVSVQYQKDSLPISLKNKITLAGYKDQTASAKFTLASAPVAIYFSEKSNPNILHTAQIIPWPKPSGITTVMSLKKKFNSNSSLYTIKGQNLHFHKSCQIEELIYIPSKYKVSVEPGITIDFKNGGGLIVNNSFSCIGTKQNPILFMSTGGGSQGLTIINADSVNIDYSKFENLSNLNFEHWQLTGAVTIYESPTTIKNTVVSNNDSEDALNIIRSNFNISELLIENTFSDGFDADFCTGIIKNSYFKNTGNDCIDFSGSVVRIDNISILNSGDKGISGGEASKLTVNNTIINGARMGIASKDASLITVSGGNISNTNYDFASFQKKSTYGPSNLIVLDEISDIGENKILVEKGSIITINDVKYKGQSVLNIEELYKDFIKKK